MPRKLLLALLIVLAGALLPRMALSAPDEPFKFGTDEPKAPTDNSGAPQEPEKEKPKGDMREFTIKTDSDISSLEVSDLYQSNGSEFKVTGIKSKSSTGGQFTIQRVAGTNDPDNGFRYNGPKPGADARKPPAEIAMRRTLIDLYLMGGFFMHFIAGLALVMVLLIVNSIWLYRRGLQLPPKFVEEARKLLQSNQIEKFEDLSLKHKGLFPCVCRGLADRYDTSNIDDIKERAQIAAAGQIARLRLPVRMLNLVAAAAPLMGLLGTMIGMVMVFEKIAGGGDTNKAVGMAAGIRVKLFSTIGALSVAIPSLFAYFIFNARLIGIIADCESLTEQFLHRIAIMKRTNGKANGVTHATHLPPPVSEMAGVPQPASIVASAAAEVHP